MKTKTAILSIENLSSASMPEVSRTLQAVSGVEEVEFSLERQVAVVEFDPALATVEDLIRAVLVKGYKVL
jgi:copper chaperone CopZ